MISEPPRIAYLVKRFPRLSETFVLNEFLQVRERLDARLYALLDPREDLVHESARALADEVVYVNLTGQPLRSRLRVLSGALAQAVSHPARLARVLWAIVTVHRSVPAIRHAFEGLWLARELRRLEVTHLHAHFAHTPAAVAYLTWLAGGPPYSFTAHAKDLYTALPRNLRIRAGAAKLVITCTAANERFLRATLGAGYRVPIHVVHHGTDLRRFHPSSRCPAPGRIVSVGRLVPKKGFSALVRAIALVARSGCDFRCDIFGGGPLRDELRTLARTLGLEPRLSFHGARSIDEIAEAYAHASVFVLSPVVTEDGDRDGIPNVLVEAMAAGVPVVSTRISGIPELIEDGVDGLLVEPGNPPALAVAITRLLSDPSLAARLAAAGRCKVEREFDLVANSRRVAELLAG